MTMQDPQNRLTTTADAPAGDQQNSLTAGARGPQPRQDVHLRAKMAPVKQERILERMVHCVAAGLSLPAQIEPLEVTAGLPIPALVGYSPARSA